MRYTFECSGPECDGKMDVFRSMSEGPPEPFLCPVCETWAMERVWISPQFICRGDPDEIPEMSRVTTNPIYGDSNATARKKERRYDEYIKRRRRLFREEGQKGGRLTHQVPTELYHGKIKQTGDKNYWRDESNLKRHKSCQVS